MKPNDIEALSFEIIDREAGEHPFSPAAWEIVRRMIHTSADFDYMESVRIHPDAIQRGIDAIRSGKPIVTDTEMARVGIRKGDLGRFGSTVECLIADPAVRKRAETDGTTRARAAVDAAAERMSDGVYVIGNAPTALLRLLELVREKTAAPALIVGLPVGFVNAAESKAELLASAYPSITNVGRKGGSNVAASVVNALVKLAMAPNGREG
jgi:precorrin-8X/cobalt-precorrin-8 methylmutase